MRTLRVKGMSCGHCVKSVTQALEGVQGVSSVNVSLEEGTASFDASPGVSMDRVYEAVERIGFEVEKADRS